MITDRWACSEVVMIVLKETWKKKQISSKYQIKSQNYLNYPFSSVFCASSKKCCRSCLSFLELTELGKYSIFSFSHFEMIYGVLNFQSLMIFTVSLLVWQSIHSQNPGVQHPSRSWWEPHWGWSWSFRSPDWMTQLWDWYWLMSNWLFPHMTRDMFQSSA